ncbi:hypothetical protein AXG93_3036s1280 [Marchantia polymorpha subsp. ruderalis]|uniref:Uncharacterized protein n=1 Tax=Marchantia polymorpha subsp. ruderalis TaxID=1480154 RepID=A0A176W8Q7_MARPO|nr:hypothetical protein AXG93_3036s1280 [Marchantia polymorpha subsp. ruderalis]
MEDWAKVLGPCVEEDGDFTFNNDSVKMTRAEENTYVSLFKKPRSSKNKYQTTGFRDWLRMNVAVALMQILWLSQTIYMTTWQVGFVMHTIAGKHIHWTHILWFTTRHHIGEAFEVSVNHQSPFFINFYKEKVRSELPAELSNTAEDPTSLEKLVDRVVKDVGRTITEQQPVPSTQMPSGTVDLDSGEGPPAEEYKSVELSAADMLGEQVIPLLRYLDGKMAKYTEPAIAVSYVELELEMRLRQTKLECVELRKNLVAEKEIRASSERDCTSLQIDIENARKATIDLRYRLKASRVAFNEGSRRMDELTCMQLS